MPKSGESKRSAAASKAAAKKGAAKKGAAKKRASKKPASKPASNPPDAVRVWRGFRLSTLAQPDFLTALGTIFIPVTAQLQRLYGLTAYLPTVTPLDKAAGVPDEIALVFYDSQQAYNDTKLIVAGRAYSRLHSTVFDLSISQSGFPVLLEDKLEFDTPYYLFKDSANWQTGFSQVFVGTRKSNMPQARFASTLLDFLKRLQKQRPKGLDGAATCVNANWVLYWEHWTSEGASLRGSISDLAKLADRVLLQPSTSVEVETSLAAHYNGISVRGGESFNIRFPLAGKS